MIAAQQADAPWKRSLRIVIAEDHSDMRGFFLTILPQLGHEVAGAAKDGNELVELCQTHSPDLVIADIAMPSLDGIQASERIWPLRPLPIVLVSAHYDKQLIERAGLEHVMAFLVKPVNETDVERAIRVAMERFAEFEMLLGQASTSRQALIDRRTVEQAKAVIMRATGLNEAEAFQRLQSMASQQQRRIAETAQLMLSATNLAGDPRSRNAKGPQSLPTQNEINVLSMIAQGMSKQEVSQRLNMTADQIDQLRFSGMKRLGLRTRADIVRHASQHGWIGSEE